MGLYLGTTKVYGVATGDAAVGGGINLPTLSNPATAEDITNGKEVISTDGTVIVGTFSVDAEIAAQEEKIAEQDAIIANLMTALEGKAAGGNAKTTKTIHVDWSMDEEWVGDISYVSNGKLVYLSYRDNVETIEAEGGAFCVSGGEHQFSSDTFINIGGYGSQAYLATQDGETVYFISSGEQQ